MSDVQVTITIHRMDGKFFTNASTPTGNFICTTEQSTLDMSLASAMEWIRDEFNRVPVERPEQETWDMSNFVERPNYEASFFEVTTCPVCFEDFGSNASLQDHMIEKEHIL